MKYGTHDEYQDAEMQLADKALLTAWDCLVSYRDDLVLVGGLAIKNITHTPATANDPGPVTTDVDFGISIAADNRMYGTISDALAGHSFKWDGERSRFVRQYDGFALCIDLLTDDGKGDAGTVMVEDIPVGIVPGIDRALQCYREVKISGESLIGTKVSMNIKVAEAGPLVVLKLNAFGGPAGRKAPKDVHDALYLAQNYVDGTDQVIAQFKKENDEGNRGMEQAIRCLRQYFQKDDSDGPMSCAAFRLNNRHLEPDMENESMLIRQLCVTLAKKLLEHV